MKHLFNAIEKLKCDGYWSNRVVDFLPLALAIFNNMCVIIYTNKVNQPIIIKICPTIGETNSDHVINLDYILKPSARRRDLYTVAPIRHTDILDFKSVKTSQLKGQSKSSQGQKVAWTKMRNEIC